MKKPVFLLCICLFLSTAIFSQFRSASEAFELAQQFSSHSTAQKIAGTHQKFNLSHIEKANINNSDSVLCYYALNKDNNKGFILISGDQRAVPVLAYSDEGSFEYDNLPENLRYWLQQYNNEILSLSNQNKILHANYKQNTSSEVTTTAVAPLLNGIKWNQGNPYNLLCPLIPPANTIRSVTGCVATAMAQVMMYYKWPTSGNGSISYTTRTNSIPISVTLTGTNYDWTDMTDSYSTSSTEIQKNAVAKLLYHCGAAASMDYGESSSATTSAMANALKANFGYDLNLQRYFRNYYTRTEWTQLIKNELNAARPVLYAGKSNDGGHLFVCDGYDSNNLFHINWGWGGSSNGYFQLSALDPSVQGIGGSSTGYNTNQDIVIGIQKPTVTSAPVYIIQTNDTITFTQKTVARNSSFTLSGTKTYNKGVNNFTGSIGVALYNSSGLLTVLNSKTVSNLVPGSGWSTIYFSNTSIPTNYSTGSYKIYMVYKGSNETNWQILRSPVGTPNYLNVDITATELKFATPTNEYPTLTLDSFTKTGNLYENKTGRFNVSITNHGAEYNSAIAIYLESFDNQTSYQLVSTETINIATGETRNIEFSGNITMLAGKYYLAVMYDPVNNPTKEADIVQLGNYQLVDVLIAPTETPVLTLNSAISFPDASKVDKKLATLSATITNSTGYYDKKLIAFIFETTGGSSLGYLGYQDAIIDANETKTFHFTGELDLALKNYNAVVYYQNTENKWTSFTPNTLGRITFTLVDSPTALNQINSKNKITIYPIPAKNFIHLKSENIISTVQVSDMSGKNILKLNKIENTDCKINISGLATGIYLLKIETTDKVEVIKFNKTL